MEKCHYCHHPLIPVCADCHAGIPDYTNNRGGRPTNETVAIRAEFQRLLKIQTDELRSNYFDSSRRISASYETKIGELEAQAADLRAELRRLADWLDDNRRDITGEFDMDELLAPARVILGRKP